MAKVQGLDVAHEPCIEADEGEGAFFLAEARGEGDRKGIVEILGGKGFFASLVPANAIDRPCSASPEDQCIVFGRELGSIP